MDLLPLEATHLPKEEQERVMLSIGESEISKEICLDLLTKRLKGQKEFRPSLEEEFLLKFLRVTKFDITKAFNRIKKFYEIQAKYPDFYELCSQNAVSKSTYNKSWISPYRMADNSMLLIHKYFQLDLSQISPKEKNYLDCLTCFKAVENPLTQMSGITFLLDASGFTFTKMFHYNLKLVRVTLESAQGAFPYRIKNIHVVNSSEAFKVLYNICYPFLTKKIRNRFHIHTDSVHFKDLHSLVPPESLPQEYGGYLKESELINAMENICDKEEYFRKYSPYILSKDIKCSK